MLLSAANFQTSRFSAIQAYFFGMFVNTFGLGTLGGDLARALSLLGNGKKRSLALASVVSDRIHGLLTLLGMAVVAMIFVRPVALGPFTFPLACLCLAISMVLWRFGPSYMLRLFRKQSVLGRIAESMALAFPTKAKHLIPCTIVSAVSHLLQISIHSLMAAELQASVSFAYLLAVIPLVNIASSLPISVQGAGLREVLYVFLLVPVGVPKETAVAFGAIWLVSATLVSATGGFLIPANRRVPLIANREDHPIDDESESKAIVF
jgi:uncharacterized membrane protein YbhN (UPF0104 family)